MKFVSLFLLLCITATASDEFEPKALQTICKLTSRQVVPIGSGINTAQGVLICDHQLIRDQIRVQCGTEVVDAIVKRRDSKADLALLSVKWKQPHPVAEMAPLTNSPVLLQSLTSIGRSKDGRINIEYHAVTKVTQTEIFVDNNFVHGRSGGGIFDGHGRLVSVAQGTVQFPEPYVSYGPSLSVLTTFLGGK